MKMKKLACCAVVLAIVAIVAVLSMSRSPEIGFTVDADAGSASAAAVVQSVARTVAGVPSVSSNQTATVRGTKPYVLESEVGFDRPLRLAAEAAGVRTIGVLSRKALLIEADAAAISRLAADGRFGVTREFRPSDKIAPSLAAKFTGGADAVDVTVVTLSPADHKAVQDRVASRGGEILTGCFNEGDSFKAHLSASLVAELASCGDVRWMEVFSRPHLMNDVAVTNIAMNVRDVWKSGDAPEGLSGDGQFVTTSDSGIDTGDPETIHEDLRDRICGFKVVKNAKERDENGHGTHTAGSIVGNGTKSDGRIRGVAWGAQLYAWFCGGNGGEILTPDKVDELFRPDQENFPAYIHSASWGSDAGGVYNKRCVDIDKYVWENPEFLPVFSAGNAGNDGDGDEMTIGSPAAAKNVLAVGATQNARAKRLGEKCENGDPSVTAEYSSRGPCKDGRIKPDVAAPGTQVLSTRAYGVEYSYGVDSNTNYAYDTGTSMACPLTAGAVALVREWLMRRTDEFADEDGKRPTAALMKAIVTGGAKGAALPDNDQGWGRVDLAETLAPSNRAVKLIDRIPFAHKEDFTWLVTTTNDAPLDVQLAWIDAPGSESTGDDAVPQLVNNLDLTVRPVDNDDAVLYGNGGTEADVLNNVESVRLSGSGTGTNAYFVTVSCRNVMYDHTEGGAAALYIRGAFDPEDIREYATVRIGSRGYVSLDSALTAAREQAAVQMDPVILEILEPTVLKESQTIDFACSIVATNADPYASAVTRKDGAALNVATNGFLSLGNVVFAGSSETAVDVATNGFIAVAGIVDFGVPYGVAAIRTASADGFGLAGALDCGFALDCAVATDEGAAFGCGRADAVAVFDGITNTADRIVNFRDPAGEIRGYVIGGPVDYTLVWKKRLVPFDDSVGYFVDADGTTNTAARIDRLIEGYRQARDEGRLGAVREIVIRRNGTLTQPLSVGENLRLIGEGGVMLTVGSTAGFTVTDGGTLEVKGIAFSDYIGKALFLVNGADAKLKIGAGTALIDIKGTDDTYSGSVTVLRGSAEVSGGARFERCRTYDYGSACGGAVYLSTGCGLILADCTIADCHARSHGGAVYAETNSTVSVAGDLSLAGNTSGASKSLEDDLYLKGDAQLLLTAPVYGSVGVTRSSAGVRFADADSATIAHASAPAFFNAANPKQVAEAVDSLAGLVWTEKPVGPQPWTGDPAEASARVIYPGQEPVNYQLVSEALESLTGNATVEIIGTNAAGRVLTADVEIRHAVTLSATNANLTLERWGDCSIRIVEGGALTLKDVSVYGRRTGGSGSARTSMPLFDVCGGSLALATPSSGRLTEVARVRGDFMRNAGAVSVWKDGTFRIESGAVIRDCRNSYVDNGSGAGRGGAVLVDSGRAKLFGGMITNCFANHGGGVFIGNLATVEVKGDMVIDGNFRLDGVTPNNLLVYDCGQMVLTGELTGHVGYTEGVAADTNVFGKIDSSVQPAVRQTSAHNFTHDTNGDIGLAVGDGVETLLMWGSSLAADETYVDEDGNVYRLLDGKKAKIDVPQAIGGLIYSGTAQTGVTGIDCLITDNVATDAGPYVARATPRPGFTWPDGSTVETNIYWTIAKATNDISGVSFEDATFAYDGKSHSIAVTGEVPSGVEVIYTGDPTNRTAVGTNTVTASFNVLDQANYAEIGTNMTAKLIIEENPDVPVDPPLPPETAPFTVETNTPTPIAFRAITRKSDTEWELVVTDLVERAEYALSYTPDLLTPFKTDEWFTATSSGSTNLVRKLDEAKPAYFWRAHGRTTYMTNWLNAVPPQP